MGQLDEKYEALLEDLRSLNLERGKQWRFCCNLPENQPRQQKKHVLSKKLRKNKKKRKKLFTSRDEECIITPYDIILSAR